MATFAGPSRTFKGSSTTGTYLDYHHIAQDGTSLRHPLGDHNGAVEQKDVRKRRDPSEFSATNRATSHSLSSRNTDLSSNTQVDGLPEHCDVRTLPPWIDSFETGNHAPSRATDHLLSSPSRVHSAQHNSTPSLAERRVSHDGYVDPYEDVSRGPLARVPERGLFGQAKEPVRGRKWDFAREDNPVIMQSLRTTSPWMTFVKSSMYGPGRTEEGEKMDQAFLDAQTPGYRQPWRGELAEEDPEKGFRRIGSKTQRRIWYKRWQRILISHPLVPLAFRITVLTTSLIALGLSGSIYKLTHDTLFSQSASTYLAVVVDIVAIPYIAYITWDEYTGKPLGLRSPKAKIRLVLLDLFFIVFESANISLAFDAIRDDGGSCREGLNGVDKYICGRVKALAATLLIALFAWLFTFTVSIFRLVERVGGREDDH